MKKILLIAVNSQFIHSNPAVYSLKSFFESNFDKGDVDIVIKEFTVNDVYGNTVYEIAKERPDAVAFSLYIWNTDVVKKLVADIKRILPNAVTVMGGPEVLHELSPLSDFARQLDYILEGEGELSFSELINSGKIFEKQAATAVICPERALSPKEIPFIYTDENISLFKNRIVYYESSRGCPFSCAYCLSGGDRLPVRFIPLEKVYDHIDFFVSHGVSLVKFVDRTFNCNPERAKSIIKKIASLPESAATCFHFEVGADLFDSELISLIKSLKRGRIQIEAGIQSLNEKTLECSARKCNNKRLFENLRQLSESGNVNIHTDLIAGLPLEDLSSFKNSFNGVYSLNSHQLQLGFLKRLAGAPLCESEEKYGIVYSENAPYEVISTSSLCYTDVIELKRVEAMLERYYNSGGFKTSLEMLIKCFPSPYDLYLSLADFCEQRGALFTSVSRRKAYDLIFEFSACYFDEKERNSFAVSLLFDYFSADKSEIAPESLRFILKEAKPFKNSDCDLFAIPLPHGYTGYGIREFGNVRYLFDYSKRDSVTGLFNVIARS
ncbi:MAG: DUF4080 domain-containing protein [Clostridia bacterium]|nr:DUF4080 domain-containing protein [Clostridia bacterium]